MILHRGPISGIATFEESFVATAGYDNQIILWDSATGEARARSVHDHLANSLAFSADGRSLLTASSDYTARLWSVPDLKLLAVYADQLDDVEMAALSPDQSMVATASRDHCVRVYDRAGNQRNTLRGHLADVISVAWTSDGAELISSSDDGTIKRWRAATGELLSSYDMQGVETDTIALDPDGTIYAGDDTGDIVVIQEVAVHRQDAHRSGVKRLVLDAASKRLVSLSYDRQVKVWSTATTPLTLLNSSTLPAIVWPRSCAFLNKDTLVFATFGSTYATFGISTDTWSTDTITETLGINAVCVWEGQVVTVGDSGVVHRDGLSAMAMGSLCNFLTRAGDTLLTGGQMGTLFDATTGMPVYQHHSPLNCAAALPASADGKARVVLGAYTGEGVVLEQQSTNWSVVQILKLHENAVKGVSADESTLFAVCADNSVARFDARSLREIDREPGHDKIANGCVSLGGGEYASVSRDLTLRIWGPDGRSEIIATPHDHSVKCVSATTDGRYVAAATYNGALAVYDRCNRTWSPTTQPTTSGLSSLFFDPAGHRFLASSYDGHVYSVDPQNVDRATTVL